MIGIIEPVPRAEIERIFPELTGQKFWGEEASYDPKDCSDIHYIVYGPIEPRALFEGRRLFKSVKVLNKGENL